MSCSTLSLTLAGRGIPGYADLMERYCGLSWSDSERENWTFADYDRFHAASTHRVGPMDVLHAKLSRTDLAYFSEHWDVNRSWLCVAPPDAKSRDADDTTASAVASVARLTDTVSLALASKVMHFKRSFPVALFGKELVDWYRPMTGKRGVRAWPDPVSAHRDDLRGPSNREALNALAGDLVAESGASVASAVRLADIVILMKGTV